MTFNCVVLYKNIKYNILCFLGQNSMYELALSPEGFQQHFDRFTSTIIKLIDVIVVVLQCEKLNIIDIWLP